jgi:hypothetical protein
MQRQIRVRAVDHQPQRAAFIVQAHGDHRAIKTIIADAGHRQQQLAGRKGGCSTLGTIGAPGARARQRLLASIGAGSCASIAACWTRA